MILIILAHKNIIYFLFRFEGVGSKTQNKRPPGDKAMSYEKEKKKSEK